MPTRTTSTTFSETVSKPIPEPVPPTETPAEQYRPGILVWANPSQLVIGSNYRPDSELNLTDDFVDSFRDHGVLEPITATVSVVDPQDPSTAHLVVVRGQRRTRGSILAGLSLVPVFIVAATSDADTLLDQLTENNHRDATTIGATGAAVEQLTLLGVSDEQIARSARLDSRGLAATRRVRASAAASAAATRHPDLGLDAFAAIAEFDDDPEVQADLEEAALQGRLEQRLRGARTGRAEAAEIAAFVAELVDAGRRGGPRKPTNAAARPVDELLPAEDANRKDTTDGTWHIGCPGEFVYVFVSYDWRPGTTGGRKLQTIVFCTDPTGHGHVGRYGSLQGTAASAAVPDSLRGFGRPAGGCRRRGRAGRASPAGAPGARREDREQQGVGAGRAGT